MLKLYNLIIIPFLCQIWNNSLFLSVGGRQLVWGGKRWNPADDRESVCKHMLIFRFLFKSEKLTS